SVQFADDDAVAFARRALESPEELKASLQHEGHSPEDAGAVVEEILHRHQVLQLTGPCTVAEAQQQCLEFCKSESLQLLMELKQRILGIPLDLQSRHDALFFIRRCLATFYYHSGLTQGALQLYESTIGALESTLATT